MARKIGDLMAPNGQYETADGETKTRWIKCGVMLETDKGPRIKLEALPVGGDFDGWLSVFEEKPKQQDGFRQAPKGSHDVPF
jgi:hypothetical protein